MKIRKILYAEDGKILTDGNIYGKVIYLANNLDESDFYEITESEYETKLEKTLEDIV
ncbi:MAG: hypothetical protein J6C82_02820 [Clostridia bacterium]|nr:hypothetical protein [Clostridia bacterium]